MHEEVEKFLYIHLHLKNLIYLMFFNKICTYVVYHFNHKQRSNFAIFFSAIVVATALGYITEAIHYSLSPQQNQAQRANSVTSATGIFADILSELPTTSGLNESEYDFIIVGSGAAGAVIANRLSEVASWRILLLEAGLPENTLAQVPPLAGLLQFTDYNWGYTTEPQPNACLAMEQQRCSWPRGKALGGSTVINYMMYVRGNPEDYNRWAASGNPGWSCEDVLPYFLKSENAKLNESDPAFHSVGGYLGVESPYVSELADAFVQAGQELGYRNTDYYSPEQIGFAKVQANIRRGRRNSVASAFLAPILDRENLRILTGARVTKILIEPLIHTAYGVEYVRADVKYSVRARKEVIVSAGTINSPQLLMLSGIGPTDHLTDLGIKTMSSLPVGETMYDHLGFFGLVININTTIGSPNILDPAQLAEWSKTGGGPLSTLVAVEAVAYINTGVSANDIDYPDIELIFSPYSALPADNGAITRRGLRITDDYYNGMFASLEGRPSLSITPMLLHPKSMGHLKLRSHDPYDPPLLFANYLTNSGDIDARTLIAGIRFILRLLETHSFQKYNAQLNSKPILGCEHLPFNSDDYWYCALQFLSSTFFHPSSTCKMGPADDPTAVVNNELKVYGITNLRVADTSIIPLPLSAHTSAPTIMVGEKASDLIKRDWGAL